MLSARTLTLASKYQIGVVLLATTLAFFFWREAAAGILLGGGLMASNFWAMRYLVFKAIGEGRPNMLYVGALAFKMLVVLAVIALLLKVFAPSAAGFALGMTSLFVGIGLAMTHQTLSKQRV